MYILMYIQKNCVKATICKHHSAKLCSVTELIGEYNAAEVEPQHFFFHRLNSLVPAFKAFDRLTWHLSFVI